MYASTRSLWRDTEAVAATDVLEPGDVFNQSGSPGHVVMQLDVAENALGQRVALIGQGFMPAQEMHVLRARGEHVLDDVRFVLPEGAEDTLSTPSWAPFGRTDARRF